MRLSGGLLVVFSRVMGPEEGVQGARANCTSG